MGQHITVAAPTVVGDTAVFDTDRSLSGQDGIGFSSADEAAAIDTFPARLAGRLFTADPALSHVFVASSQAVLRRKGSWDSKTLAAASEVLSNFFVHYS